MRKLLYITPHFYRHMAGITYFISICIYLDNASSHHGKNFVQNFDQENFDLFYGSPYSCDLNPIEQMFNQIKYWFRKFNRANNFEELAFYVEKAIKRVNTTNCLNYIKSSESKLLKTLYLNDL